MNMSDPNLLDDVDLRTDEECLSSDEEIDAVEVPVATTPHAIETSKWLSTYGFKVRRRDLMLVKILSNQPTLIKIEKIDAVLNQTEKVFREVEDEMPKCKLLDFSD
ncbi:hypothetical protein ACOME3_002547 [Neoechinorhynchus agilis]